MDLRSTKNTGFCPMGLCRGMQSALAIVATLALVSAAQAQITTYTWTGASTAGPPDEQYWFNDYDGTFYYSDNFDSPTLVSSITDTDIVMAGSAQPDTLYAADFQTRSLTFNTSVDFSISQQVGNQGLIIGAGGINNQVAQKQTLNLWVATPANSTLPVNVAAGGEIVMNRQFYSESLTADDTVVVEKTGPGTLTYNNTMFTKFKVQAGTLNLNGGGSGGQTFFEVNGGTLNLGNHSISTGTSAGTFSQTGGNLSMMGQLFGGKFVQTGGTMTLGDTSRFGNEATFSSGTVSFSGGPTGNGPRFGTLTPGGNALTISGGSQDFRRANVLNGTVLLTGGTTSGLAYTKGVTNQGGSLNFTPGNLAPNSGRSFNSVADLNFTSGDVSIAGGGTGSLVNGTIANPLNTYLGAGNTLKLDFNEDLTRDLLITSGTLNWGGNVALNLTNLGEVANGSSWNFFNDGVLGNTGAFAGTLDGISLAATDTYNGLTFSKSGSLWTSTSTGGGQQFTFNETTGVLAVVPEPSSIAVVGMGLAMLGWRRLALRRRAAA